MLLLVVVEESNRNVVVVGVVVVEESNRNVVVVEEIHGNGVVLGEKKL